ncbi:MAG TPA: hypothetical protein VG815_05550 [Chloroflexota bacterium]|jgi:hypothetical protein|nr:hypothetical protein [Chloroflexota bacterium]
MPLPFGETITVTRQTVNQFGDHVAGQAHDITGCAVWPTTSTETIVGGMDVVVFGLTALLPPGSDVLPTDTVTVRGVVYRVNGQPSLFKSPLTGFESGIEILLTQATG